MSWRGARQGEAEADVHRILKVHGFDDAQALVVIHGQHSIKRLSMEAGEEAICGEGAFAQEAEVLGLLEGGPENAQLLVAMEPSLACVWVERQHGQACCAAQQWAKG